MALIIHLSTAVSLAAKYVTQKGQSYYYSRRIPSEFAHLYDGKRTFVQSLKTRDPMLAAQKAQALAKQQDAYWASLQNGGDPALGLDALGVSEAAKELLAEYGLKQGDWNRRSDSTDIDDLVGGFLDHVIEPYRADDELDRETEKPADNLPPVILDAFRMLKGERVYRLSDAEKLYLKFRAFGDDATGRKSSGDARRVFLLLKESLGHEDRLLTEIRRDDANQFVEYLLGRGLKTASVRRALNPVKAAFGLAVREFELSMSDPFLRVEIPRLGRDSKDRVPFTDVELREVARTCRQADDDIRWLIAMLMDTGSRMAESVGLKLDDLRVDASVPHVVIAPNELRRLKTLSSARLVPLVGMSLWAAKRILAKASKGQIWAFPRYVRENEIASTHASNTINKWIRAQLSVDKTAHSFRHSMRDRLREVGAPSDIQDAIGGWAREDIGAKYGQGYSLKLLASHMRKIVLTEERPKKAVTKRTDTPKQSKSKKAGPKK